MGNRVIKFRAWRNEEMSKPFTIGEGVCWPSGSVSTAANLNVMQFTGLYDSKCVEIYEGDILSYLGYKNLGHDTVKSIGAVKYGETGDSDGWAHGKHYEYVVGADSLADVADSDYPDESYCEVIGNIYENPDLLERDA